MPSNIGQFQALMAAMTVDFTDQDGEARSISGLEGASLRSQAHSADLPVRLILPYSDVDRMYAVMGEPMIGNEVEVVWTILDQLLWRSNVQGIGLEDSAFDLREYASAYITAALGLDASSIADNMVLNRIDITIRDDIGFPGGSPTGYIGVDCVWTITESDPL